MNKRELEAEIESLRNALEMTDIEGTEIIGELKWKLKDTQEAFALANRQLGKKADQITRLQMTITDLNARNNRLRDCIVANIEQRW